MANPTVSRTLVSPSVGARVCLMIATLLLVAAGFAWWVPITIPTSNGQMFQCGSASSPKADTFPRAVCGDRNKQNRFLAFAFVLGAVVVGVGGFATFGVSRRTETKGRSSEDDSDEG